MKFNLNNKKFKAEANAENGEVSAATIFSYHQSNDIIWAEYEGGQIAKGNLLGLVIDDHLEFSYHHLNTAHKLMTGKCKSYPALREDGKIILNEIWQWTCGDQSSGTSTLIEIV